MWGFCIFSTWLYGCPHGILASSHSPKDMQASLTCRSKLTIGTQENLNGCLSLYVSFVLDERPVQGVSHLLLIVRWDWLKPPGQSKNLCHLQCSCIPRAETPLNPEHYSCSPESIHHHHHVSQCCVTSQCKRLLTLLATTGEMSCRFTDNWS